MLDLIAKIRDPHSLWMGITFLAWVKTVLALFAAYALGRTLRPTLIRQLQKWLPHLKDSLIDKIGGTIQWSIFFLFLCVLARVIGVAESFELSADTLKRSNSFINFGIYVIAGWLLGRIFSLPVTLWLERTAPDQVENNRVGRMIEWSTFILVFSIVMKAGAIDVLKLPGWAWEKTHAAFTVFIALSSTTLFLQFIEVGLQTLRRHWQAGKGQVDDHLISFLRKGIRIFIVTIMLLITADNLGFKVTGAIAGLGIGGAAVALAAQGLIANLLGTIEIVADKLYRVGDRIHFDNYDGFVTEVGLRSTRIRALTGEKILVPNRRMAEVQIRNYSLNGTVRTTLSMDIVYSTTHGGLQQAMDITSEILKARKDVDNFQIFIKELGSYAIHLEAVFWAHYQESKEYNSMMGQLHLEVKRRFDEAGILFAFPTQTVHVASSFPPSKTP